MPFIYDFMPEIPDYISLSELSKLSKSAPPGVSEVDANDFILHVTEFSTRIASVQEQMQVIRSTTVGQERLQRFEQAQSLLAKAQALLLKCTQT